MGFKIPFSYSFFFCLGCVNVSSFLFLVLCSYSLFILCFRLRRDLSSAAFYNKTGIRQAEDPCWCKIVCLRCKWKLSMWLLRGLQDALLNLSCLLDCWWSAIKFLSNFVLTRTLSSGEHSFCKHPLCNE